MGTDKSFLTLPHELRQNILAQTYDGIPQDLLEEAYSEMDASLQLVIVGLRIGGIEHWSDTLKRAAHPLTGQFDWKVGQFYHWRGGIGEDVDYMESKFMGIWEKRYTELSQRISKEHREMSDTLR